MTANPAPEIQPYSDGGPIPEPVKQQVGVGRSLPAPYGVTTSRQEEDEQGRHHSSVVPIATVVDLLRPVVELDPADGLEHWAARIRQITEFWGSLKVRERLAEERAEGMRKTRIEAIERFATLIELLTPLIKLDPDDDVSGWEGEIHRSLKDIEANRHAWQELERERERNEGLRKALAIASGAPRQMDTTWEELVVHVGTNRHASAAPVLTEEEMDARCRAWMERPDRMRRIEILRAEGDSERAEGDSDRFAVEEREAAIAHHQQRVEEQTRFALTGRRG